MNPRAIRLILTTAVALGAAPAWGQGYDFGSNGSAGAINVTVNTVYPLPPDGVIHATTVTITSGTLSFLRNASNTPVILLAQGDVFIGNAGAISVVGGIGTPTSGGPGGPGAFDGGQPGFTGTPAGDGKGPGGGKAGTLLAGDGPGDAGHRNSAGGARDGAIYGSALQIPLLGGSGGGGRNDAGGALNSQLGGSGGGGAILIASNTLIDIDGSINAYGGTGGISNASGGAVRLLAPRVDSSGSNLICVTATSGCSTVETSGAGYVRVDTIDRSALTQAPFRQSASLTVGSYMTVNGPVTGKLRVASVAGTPYVPDSGPVTVVLPSGSPTSQPVTIEALDFGALINLKVAVTPDSGPSVLYDLVIDNTSINPAANTVNVVIPPNTRCVIHAWRV